MNNKDNILNKNSVLVSKCINCDKCCLSGETIPLNPIDLINIKKKMNIPIREILKKYCSYATIKEYSFPILVLKKSNTCVLGKNYICKLGDNKPNYCKTYPLIRTTNTKGNFVFYCDDKKCNEYNIKGISSVKKIIENPTEEYNLCIEDWYKAIENFLISTPGDFKSRISVLDEDSKELIDIIILHIMYRSLEDLKSEDYKIIRNELKKRYRKVEEFILEVKCFIEEILYKKEYINKTSRNFTYLYPNLNKISLPEYKINELKVKYVLKSS